MTPTKYRLINSTACIKYIKLRNKGAHRMLSREMLAHLPRWGMWADAELGSRVGLSWRTSQIGIKYFLFTK